MLGNNPAFAILSIEKSRLPVLTMLFISEKGYDDGQFSDISIVRFEKCSICFADRQRYKSGGE